MLRINEYVFVTECLITILYDCSMKYEILIYIGKTMNIAVMERF